MSSSCSSTGSPLSSVTAVIHILPSGNTVQAPATGTLETSHGSLSVMPGEIVGELIRFNPDSVLTLRVVSRALKRISEEFLQMNATEIAIRCSEANSSLYRRVYNSFINFSIRHWSEAHHTGVLFHVSMTNAIRSMGVSPADCSARILLSEEIGRFTDEVQNTEDVNLQRIWGGILRAMSQTRPLPVGLPEVNASAQDIRAWMHADANQPLLGGITVLYLNSLQLTYVPEEVDLFTGLERLDLSRNQLTSIPEGLFNGLAGLRRIDLNDNQLGSLPAGLFNGLAMLEQLFLHQNHLGSLPPDLFDGLSRLTMLSLGHNRLITLPPDLFNGLPLGQLQLYNNQLRSLPPGLFAGLSGLRYLYLQNNQLSSLPPGLFSGLTGMSQLSLANNPLSSLPPGLFAGLGDTILVLNRNPGLLTFNKRLLEAPELGKLFADAMDEFFNYRCRSPLARLYQVAAGGNSPEAVKEIFLELSDNTQNAIFGMVYLEADAPDTDDLQWGEHHVFDDMQIFNSALKRHIWASVRAQGRGFAHDTILRMIDGLREI